MGAMTDDQNSGRGCVAVGLGLGVLVALGLFLITLPNWLASGASKARQTEGAFSVASLNRAQQAYYLEHGQFATSFDALEIGIVGETDRFSFSTIALGDLAVQNSGMAKQQELYDVIGLVWVVDVDGDELITNSQFCQGISLAHEEDSVFPKWLRQFFTEPDITKSYLPQTPPQFELPELPASSDTIVLCPEGYEENQ